MISDEIQEFTPQWLDSKPYIEAFTSGSTGIPKRIELPKSDMRASAEATCRRFGIDHRSILHLCLSLRYIAGKMMMVRSFVSGARIISEEPSNHPLYDVSIPSIQNLLKKEKRISLSAIVPSQIEGLLQTPALPFIDTVIVGGAPMTPQQEQMLLCHNVNAYATYGMTETCSHVALRAIGTDRYTAMPGITFDTDPRNCLVINAPHYTFGQLVTNDIVTLTGEDSFIWHGRYDNVINSGGVKIHPEEIERALASIMGNSEYFVTSRPSERWGEEMILVTTPTGLSAEEIMAACRLLLPSIKCPKEVIIRPMLPHTSTGKILRKLDF